MTVGRTILLSNTKSLLKQNPIPAFPKNQLLDIQVPIKQTKDLNEISQLIEDELLQLKRANINSVLCISHSYFIGALNLYFNGKIADWTTVTDEEIHTAEIPGYLKGFSTTI